MSVLNSYEYSYKELLAYVLDGDVTPNRNQDTFTRVACQISADLSEGFPMLTGKKMFTKNVIHELKWMLNGNTNTKYLKENGVNIWDLWSYKTAKYPDKKRLLDWVKEKEAQKFVPYNGNFSTKGLNIKRGSFDDHLRNLWGRMMRRCYDINSHNYKYYGKLGVSVCKDWHDFHKFLSDIKKIPNFDYKLKDPLNYNLDKDYFGSNIYSKSTCVWLHKKENNLYVKSSTPFEIIIQNKKYTCISYKDCEIKTGIPKSTIHRWVKNGFPKEGDFKYKKYGGISFKHLRKKGYNMRYLFTNGDLGPIYGKQMRDFGGIDQIEWVLKELKSEVRSRRCLVSMWNPHDLPYMKLPPCHYAFNFVDVNGKLDLVVSMRSLDLFVGLPYDMTFYSLMLILFCNELDKEIGSVHINAADCHIYTDHKEAVLEYLGSEIHNLPDIIVGDNDGPLNFDTEAVKLIGYSSEGFIKAKIHK